jgi:chitin disaccharide deacetylase
VTTPGTRVLALCADDIGLVAGAAETAHGLAARGRLSAASCVTTSARWRADAAWLVASSFGAELGLHFNLSEGRPLSAALARHWPLLPGLLRLLVLAPLGDLPIAAIGDEWRAQVDAFTNAVGRAPDFVDGHQHVHALAGVRDIVLADVATWRRRPAVRNTGVVCGPGAALKRRTIEAWGGRALQRRLVAARLPHNRALLGAYDFRQADYRGLVQAWLARAPQEGGLLFCHPCTTATAGDPIAAARRREALYLESDDFAADLAEARITLGAAWAVRSSSGD